MTMFQTFDTQASPAQGPARLATLRRALAAEGLAGFIIPRADLHQGEYVAARDERLQWLTGFTGSAGFSIVLPTLAGVFIDGRYRTQVKGQVDLAHFTPVPWPETKPGDWIKAHLPEGVVGFDPWLHSADEIAKLEAALEHTGVILRPCANQIDRIWPDQPGPPLGRAFPHPDSLAGETSTQKRTRLAEALRTEGQTAAVITLPDSICWLLNIRGGDVPRNPILHALAILHDNGHVTLFADAAKFDEVTRSHLGAHVSLRPVSAFVPALHTLQGPVRPPPPKFRACARRICATARRWSNSCAGWTARRRRAACQKSTWCGRWKVSAAPPTRCTISPSTPSAALAPMVRSCITG
jgi:Xaa-Pro aminopeptidase